MSAAVFLLSAAVLAHEICLLRVLSIAYWHHAASLVVAVALLGFGVAGTLLALAPRLKRDATLFLCAAIYAALIPSSLHAAGAVDFNIREVGWDPSQWLRLLALQAVFFVPFVVAALGIAVALALRSERPGRIYAANLLGSGAGALAAPLLLQGRAPEDALLAVALTSAAACCVRLHVVGVAAGVVAALVSLGAGIEMSPFKDWAAAPEKRNIATSTGPLGRVDRADIDSLHHAPGLSLLAPVHPENQTGLFVDGHLAAALGAAPYLDHTVGALPFVLASEPRTLLLGVGPDLQRASEVVETNADLLRLAGIDGVAREPHAFLEETSRRYDLIVHHIPALHAAAETPLLTVGGLERALTRADAVAFSCRLAVPPRSGLKLLATAERVTRHVVAIRSADRLCVVLRRRAPTEQERARVLSFCNDNGFDPVRPLAWRFASPYHETDTPLLDPGPDYPYDVRPATDARPYFFKFFRWSRLRDLFDPDRTPFVQWPFVALMVAFLQVTVVAVLLMAGPLLLSRAARSPAGIFLALGLGFMLLEMAFLQRAMVRLGSPVHAAAAVLGGFLVGAGCGSLASERLGRPLRRAALAVALLAPLGYLLLPRALLPAALVCAAVAFPMGMPFPSALSRVAPTSIPWALAWNGCASVAAAAAAPLVSSTWGIPAAAGAGLLAYLLVAIRAGRA